MSIWKRLFSKIGLRTDRRSPTIQNSNVRLQVSQIAKYESRPEPEIVSELLVAGLQKYYSRKQVMPLWESLTPREKEVGRLIERGLTNQKIAEHLSISVQTVQTHVAHILKKFRVKEKSDVRHMLGVMRKHHWI